MLNRNLFKKLLSIFCKFLPINKNKILLINEANEFTEFDKLLTEICKKNKYILIKSVNFKNDNIDFKRYPPNIKLIPKASYQEIYDLKTSRLVISLKIGRNFKKKKYSQVGIVIPNNEVYDKEFMENIKFYMIRGFDFWISTNDNMFNILKIKFKDKVQQLKYGNPTSDTLETEQAKKRFIKLIEIIMNCNDYSMYELFRRCNLKNYRYCEMALYHHYFSLYKMNLISKLFFAKYIEKKLDLCCKKIYKAIFYILPIKNNRIVIRNFQHKYGDNPKYITEELLRRKKNYEIIWIVDLKKNSKDSFPKNIKIFNNNTFMSWYALYTAHIWIDNNVRSINPLKKNRQFYIQTWHGSMGIKKFDNVWPKNVIDENNKITDVCLSNSKFETEVYKTTIWKDVNILEIGHPRNDILFNDEIKRNLLKKQILNRYGLSDNINIILYAPTFRDTHLLNKNNIDMSMYLSEYDKVIDAIENKFGGEWIIFERLHYHLNAYKFSCNNSKVINVSSYNDMQELIFISDIAISDYSSWIYDFVLTGRPGFIYAIDKNEYLKERDLYFQLEETPFPVAYSLANLIDNISNFDSIKYDKNINNFLKLRGCVEHGNASTKTVDLIDSIIFTCAT